MNTHGLNYIAVRTDEFNSDGSVKLECKNTDCQFYNESWKRNCKGHRVDKGVVQCSDYKEVKSDMNFTEDEVHTIEVALMLYDRHLSRRIAGAQSAEKESECLNRIEQVNSIQRKLK